MSRRVALVIGNQDYAPHARALKGPTGDALRMARLFEDLGFDLITPQINADFNAIRQSVRAFAAAMETGGIGAFYFSGHGVQGQDKENYLVPLNASLKEPEDIAQFCFPIGRVINAMHEAGSFGLLFLDACRDDPFAGAPEGARTKNLVVHQPGLSPVARASLHNVLISYATGAGNTALDGDADRSSHYAQALMTHLKTPGVPVGSLLRRVSKEVSAATSLQQVPWFEDSLHDDLVLVPGPPPTEPTAPTGPTTPPEPPVPTSPTEPTEPTVPTEPTPPTEPSIPKEPPMPPANAPAAKNPQPRRLLFGFLAAVLVLIVAFLLFIFGPLLVTQQSCDTSTPARAIACRVPDLGLTTSRAARDRLSDEIGRALADSAVPLADKAAIIDALLKLAQPESLRSLTEDGRLIVLEKLSGVTEALWMRPATREQLETAHQTLASIDSALTAAPLMEGRAKMFLVLWKTSAGYVQRDSIRVFAHFAGYTRAEFGTLMTALQQGWGWKLQPVDAQTIRPGQAEIRYGDNRMLAAATLMAAQLNGQVAPRNSTDIPWDQSTVSRVLEQAKVPVVRVVRVAAIPATNLEIWIGK